MPEQLSLTERHLANEFAAIPLAMPRHQKQELNTPHRWDARTGEPLMSATQQQVEEIRQVEQQPHYNVLFLCTGNSARSILAAAILNHRGRSNFTAYSGGSFPTGSVHPMALKQLEVSNLPTDGLRSKSWDEFGEPGAPQMDFIITVCDNAAGEVCPIWPGQPVTAHWGVPDPASVSGSPEEIEHAFREAFMILERRISLFLCLPLAGLETIALRKEVDNVGVS
jgi:arsenate reductase (thioredoxin)